VICNGCSYAPVYDDQGNEVAEKKCPFCRTPWSETREEENERVKKRVEAGDCIAINDLGNNYRDGSRGFPQDYTKALELWHRAGKLGDAMAYHSIGNAYKYGRAVKMDVEKARHYWELAAIGGISEARFNLGCLEGNTGNNEKALKHWMIATKDGDTNSLEYVKRMYGYGDATKDDYANALRSYQAYLDEIKSDQRDEAAAFKADY